jgi:hypothetical protein
VADVVVVDVVVVIVAIGGVPHRDRARRSIELATSLDRLDVAEQARTVIVEFA